MIFYVISIASLAKQNQDFENDKGKNDFIVEKSRQLHFRMLVISITWP